MIVKKVPNPAASERKAVRISRLAAYIRDPSAEDGDEKCTYAGTRGFITDDWHSQVMEMIAVSEQARRSPDTVMHHVLSWRAGEHPTPTQVDEAVAIFLEEMGLADHQAIYGLHVDTQNDHVHIMANRVHPMTQRCVKVNRGFDLEAAHRAVARIEHAQGWASEQRGRYAVDEAGSVARAARQEPQDAPRKQPSTKRRDMEVRTGEQSAERRAIDIAGPIIRAAQSWRDLHQALAAEGMRFERKGSGALIHVGDVAVKASSVDRAASLRKLEGRLGAYEPAPEATVVAPAPEPAPMPRVPAVWHDYAAGRRAAQSAKREAGGELARRHTDERRAMTTEHRSRRREILGGGAWRGRGIAWTAMRSVLAAEAAAARAALLERQRQEREALRRRHPSWPSFETWLRMRGRDALAEGYRYRAIGVLLVVGGVAAGPPSPVDIRAYRPVVYAGMVEYCRAGTTEVAFADRGDHIAVYLDERSAIRAALQLAAARWGGQVYADGDEDYIQTVLELAAELGVRIANPELQDRYARECERVREERRQAAALPAVVDQVEQRQGEQAGAANLVESVVAFTVRAHAVVPDADRGDWAGLQALDAVGGDAERLRARLAGDGATVAALALECERRAIDLEQLELQVTAQDDDQDRREDDWLVPGM